MSKFNFDQMIDDLAKEKGISKTKFDQVAENIETVEDVQILIPEVLSPFAE